MLSRSSRNEQQRAQALEPFRETLARLDTIPGVGPDVAEVIIAETGADMSRFPTPGHLASWAGVAPGLNQSGERHKPARTRHGDHWLTGALGVAAMAANRTQDSTFLGARYRRPLPAPATGAWPDASASSRRRSPSNTPS